jgi:hypothetical protein
MDSRFRGNDDIVYERHNFRDNNMKFTATLLSIITLAFAAPALAYIDPGSGSAILSAIAGLLVAVTIAVKSYWYKLKSFFTGSKKNSKKTAEQESQ